MSTPQQFGPGAPQGAPLPSTPRFEPLPPTTAPSPEFAPTTQPAATLAPAPDHVAEAPQRRRRKERRRDRAPQLVDHPELDRQPALHPVDPPLSPRTGEPTRPALVAFVAALWGVACAFAIGQVIGTFWVIVHDWRSATFLLRHLRPAEMSFPLVAWSTLGILHAAALAAVCGWTGFQAWNGERRARIGAVVALVLAALGFLINLRVLWALALVVPGVLLLWLPRTVHRYNALQDTFRYRRAHPTELAALPDDVSYGPLPRYRER